MRRMKYIHQRSDWPNFWWEESALVQKLSVVHQALGRLSGRMETLGFLPRNNAVLRTLTFDVLKTSEIEGEILSPEQVRSSIARRLGIDIEGMTPTDRHVEGVVDMTLDATQNFHKPLSAARLFRWHAALFPTGYSGMHKVAVGRWRNDESGPMQVVSGPVGRERVHFEAPDAKRLKSEMTQFIRWVNNNQELDMVLKAAVAHLWFVTIHPFDDGNGRIGRAISDWALARAANSFERFYSLSAQICIQRSSYYSILEKTQKGSLDVTLWIEWFLDCLTKAVMNSEGVLSDVIWKAKFWKQHEARSFNERQRLMLNKLLEHFEGKLTSSKWAKICKCSQDTAQRDIQALVDAKILSKDPAGGRSTSYSLSSPPTK